MIDWAHVAGLCADFGEEEFAEVVALFMAEVQEGLGRLAMADTPDAHRLAFHFLKGAALNLGFVDMAALTSAGEENATRGTDFRHEKEQVLALFPPACTRFEREWREKTDAIRQ